MSRRRRALLLLLLSALLGSLAAASVQRRETALQRALGPRALVLVTRTPVRAGAALATARPLLRPLPRQCAPPDAVTSVAALVGARAAVALPAGAYVTAATLRSPAAATAPVGPGERVAQIVAHADPAAVVPGARVDVLVTREARGSIPGTTVLALADVEVLAVSAAPPPVEETGGARVAVSLRVGVRAAVYLAAAQSFAHDLRLLVRAAGDRGGRRGLSIDDRLR